MKLLLPALLTAATAACHLAPAARAQVIWASPDCCGGFFLNGESRGMGHAFPDGNGGFFINPPRGCGEVLDGNVGGGVVFVPVPVPATPMARTPEQQQQFDELMRGVAALGEVGRRYGGNPAAWGPTWTPGDRDRVGRGRSMLIERW
jgi:hypothetical protein